jgi:23S rRNA pseudouridine1911/1915/1917 synthase
MKILYEDNHLLVVNKNSGDLVQSDQTGDLSLEKQLKAMIKKRDKKPGNVYLGVVHRLDRPVSGVVLFTKTSKALSRMNKQFREREVTKTYYAVVENRPKELSGKLVHYLSKNREKNLVKASKKPGGDRKKAELSYDYIGTGNHRSLLRVNPKTGRPHQIRVQLAKMGCPIDGDLKYGSKVARSGMIHLHAYQLDITHPTTKEKMEFIAPLPDDFNWAFFQEYV